MLKDVVILSGAVGSTYSIYKEIIGKHALVQVHVIFLNNGCAHYFRGIKNINSALDWMANSSDSFYEQFRAWSTDNQFPTKPILFCTSDQTCIFISQYREWFESNYELTIPSNVIIRNYNDKHLAYEAARQVGLLLPKTRWMKEMSDLTEVNNNFTYPVILKPCDAASLQEIGFKVKVCVNQTDLSNIHLQLIKQGKTYLCQEYIPGNDDKYWFYLFYRNTQGKICECIGQKVVQHPRGKGIMAAGITKSNQKLSETAQLFLRNIDYCGVGGIEFKEYEGDFYFIEMSTRIEAFISISESMKVSIPLLIYDNINHYPILPIDENVVNNNRLYIDIFLVLIEIMKRKSFALFLFMIKIIFTKYKYVNPQPFSYILNVLRNYLFPIKK